ANGQTNITLVFFAPGATIQGNYIGTDVTGTRALGTTSVGINIGTSNNMIGGAGGARNVISGNGTGVQIGFGSPGIVGNVVQGNFIGVNATGTRQVPNSQQAIVIAGGTNNIIGGTENGAGNTIAFNGSGVAVTGSGQGNAIRGNSIFSNLGLGIDLGVPG